MREKSACPQHRPDFGVLRMSKTVMIVEDNELNMKLFRDLIEANGYKTVHTLSLIHI